MRPVITKLSLEDVWDLVGRPSKPGAIYFRSHETGSIFAWEDQVCGRAGWSWAIARGDLVVSHGWAAGRRVDRDSDITRAIAGLQHVIDRRGVA